MRKPKNSLGAKFCYATGDILGGGAFALISLLFLNYLVTVEGINASIAGTIVMIGKIWDAISDPLMGIVSDRTKSKLGKRRIYLLAGVLPVIATFTMLWYNFGIDGTVAKVVYYSAAYILFSTAFTLVMVPYNALLPDMIDSYKDRAGFSTIRMFVSNLAALVSVVAPGMILGARGAKDYLKMGILFGCLYGLPLLITCFGTWELPSQDNQSATMGQMLKQLGNSFHNKAYRQYLGIFVCGQMATDVCTTLVTFWLADILGRQGLLSVVSGITMIVAVLLLPLNNYLAKKYGKHVPAIVEQPIRIVALILAFFMGKSSGMVMLIIVCILNGAGGSASSFVPWSLLPDLPDSDEMITGKRNAGIYAGVSTFVRKFTSGFAIFIIGVAMNAFGYMESMAGEVVTQADSTLWGIRILYCIVPIVLTVVTIILASKYTLTITNHAFVRKAIEVKRQTGMPCTDKEVISACEHVAGRSFETMWVGVKADENGK